MSKYAYLGVVLCLCLAGLASQRRFAVTFTVEDKRYTEEVGADTSEDARRAILSRYPKAVIWEIKELK